MIEILQWPPQQFGTYTAHGRDFVWEGDESFVVLRRDGTVETDPQAKGFINRIQRYGIANKFPESEWSLQNIYSEIRQKVPAVIRGKFFRDAPIPPKQMYRIHTAPVPPGLADAAGHQNVADDDPDLPAQLATLTPERWLEVLRAWVSKDKENRRKKHIAGPVWWWALHSVSINPGTGTPLRFVGEWLNSFVCRKCRIQTRTYMAANPIPPSWEKFEDWAVNLHTHVTEKIGVPHA